MLRAEKSKLLKHFNGHHKGYEGKFLKYGEQPNSNVYQNFEEFLKNSKTDLLLKAEDKKRLYGRPTKDIIKEIDGDKKSKPQKSLVVNKDKAKLLG